MPFLRPFPHIKHLGGFGQARYGELARRAGFDDALLTGPDGTISEGAVTNIAFYDGTERRPRSRPAVRARRLSEFAFAGRFMPLILRTYCSAAASISSSVAAARSCGVGGCSAHARSIRTLAVQA